MPEQPLRNRVAVVAGATRGAGRGIARMLGAAGATVYCTGRSVRGRPATPGRPETIEETAALVTAEGARGIAVRTDHTVESAVEQLFARVRAEAGRLDVLVNDIWGGDALTEWGRPFWELTIAQGQQMLERAVHSHITTSRHGAPLMIERDAGLIVEVTDGDTLGYRGNLFYDLAKNAVIRLAHAMAADLHTHRVTALAITPGFLRSEAALDTFGVTEANWRDAIEKDPYFAGSETPCLVGRAVAALAADPNVGAKSGGLFSTWALSKEYGLTDVDGGRPDWGTFFPRKVQEIVDEDEPTEMNLFIVRTRLYQAELDPAGGRRSRAPSDLARPSRLTREPSKVAGAAEATTHDVHPVRGRAPAHYRICWGTKKLTGSRLPNEFRRRPGPGVNATPLTFASIASFISFECLGSARSRLLWRLA